MAQKYPGFYLYFDWIDALSTIPPTKAMRIIHNMREYLEDGTPPPQLTGAANSIQLMMLAQLTRAKINAENGRLGGAPAHKKRVTLPFSLDRERNLSYDNPNESLYEFYLREKAAKRAAAGEGSDSRE